MAGKVEEIQLLFSADSEADFVTRRFRQFNDQREVWKAESLEIRNYVYATDNSESRGEGTYQWANTTHVPKLAQIYDNLKSNYMSALFPNDDWLQWLAGDREAATQEKRKAILSYMQNKLRESKFYTTCAQLIDDYILYGNAIADVEYVKEETVDELTGETIPGYIGPKATRISPYDIVFNPLAPDFGSSPKITRYVVNLGELELMALEQPEDAGWIEDNIKTLSDNRHRSMNYSTNDFEKIEALQIDGFGNFYDYLTSGYMELLEFEGDYFNPETGELETNMVITIADGYKVVRKVKNPSCSVSQLSNTQAGGNAPTTYGQCLH